MTQTNSSDHGISVSPTEATPPQSVVDRFEQAWEVDQRPLLDDYLPADSPERLRLLGVLVHIDLERRLKAGEAMRVETYLQRYAELADDPELVLALIAREFQLRRRQEPTLTPDEYVLRFPDRAAAVQERLEQEATATGAGLATLPPGGGRYRPVRFHARGGLGEVFVALDEEVHREVALKRMQPRHAADPEVLRRFLREAEITAQLEHPGIVPVYGVVRDADGQPCYAMRFIQGDSLDEAIQDFHQADKGERDPSARSLALRQLLQRFITVCNTIAYAHSRGVLHRDLKPGNIMLGKYGETLVVDWGLARTFERSAPERADGEEILAPAAGTKEQTQLGQAQGTPAYMSPEQAAGRWDVIGPATDIYSLGATLYALLTGQPPFRGGSPTEVMQQVQRGAVVPPRKVKKEVPAALEAVCLKAMALKPEDRYLTAQDLAADIEPWLADEPVSAYREPWRTRVRRWVKRHRLLATGVVVALLMLGLLGGGGWLWWAAGRAETARQVEAALEGAQGLYERGQVYEALAEVRRATGLLESGGGSEALGQRVRQMQEDLEMVELLEEVRLRQAEITEGQFEFVRADQEYAAAFQRLGLDLDWLTLAEAAARIKHRLIKDRLAAALDDWAYVRREFRKQDPGDWQKLVELASRVDPDPWRNRLRAALVSKEAATLKALAAAKELADLPPPTFYLLGVVLARSHPEEAIRVLRTARQKYPGDFWINQELGGLLARSKSPHTDEAIRFLTAASALRWRNPVVHINLGAALADKGEVEGAIQAFQAALRLKKDFPDAHSNLGAALAAKGDLDGAIAACKEALRLQKDLPDAHNNLGLALEKKGDLVGAIQEYREALRYKKDYPEAYYNLGNALADQGDLVRAIKEYREALRHKKNYPQAYYNLGNARYKKGDLEGAIQEYREALRYKKDYPQAYYNLGTTLQAKGEVAGAIQAFQEALRLKKDYPQAHNNLGNALALKGDLEGAIQAFQEALRLKKDYPEAHFNLGNARYKKGDLDGAIQAYQAALRYKKDFPDAHNSIGVALAAKGDLDGAIQQFQEALRLKKDDPQVHNNLGNALREKGDLDGAIQAFQEALRLKKDYPEAHNNLGIALGAKGDTDGAIKEIQEALRLKKDFPQAHTNLGTALMVKGDPVGAIQACQEALRLKKDDARLHLALGLALQQNGQFPEALAALKRGHALASQKPGLSSTATQWVRACERLLELDGMLPQVLRQEIQPSGPAEVVEYAHLCTIKKLHAASARLYAAAFADQPQLADPLRSPNRHIASRAAAQAGCGQGKDAAKLDAKERERLR
jgi:tetratricopeptide (TPR) repeat protein/tRNA A-37 threonylcarbamoyl transferase component Bud32